MKFERKKLLLPITFFLTFCVAGASHAALTCERIGEDEFSTEESLYIDGPDGAYSYNAYNGSRQVLEVLCDRFDNGTDEGLICTRVFERPDGVTTEHYLVPKISRFTSLIVSTFIENSESILNDDQHNARLNQLTVSCRDDG